ncbi:MAG: transglycosylase domain-containing protein [Bacilli bacterium]|nr:transglycosylase domain-containing protein [Bacilli bacterium]
MKNKKNSSVKNKTNLNKGSNGKKKISNNKITNNKVSNKKNIKDNKKVVSKKSKLTKVVTIILIILLSLIIIGCICVGLFFSMIVKEAPEFDPQNLYTMESSIVYGGSGNEIAKLGVEKREKVSYDDLPQVLIDAIVATEDSAFFQHNGFNAARFLKASLSQIFGGGGGGASTLTMQVSKNAYTSDVSSGFEGIKRKFTDIYLSIFKIEKTYTKEQIMEFYVNSYYMGGGAYGVEQACLNYFGKSVGEINLAEAAMLAGIYQAPGTYDPTINPEATEERRKIVLNLMLRHGYITEEEKDMASQLTVDKLLHSDKSDGSDEVDPRYRDFIDTVVEDIKKKTGYDPYTTPMLIYTTMDEAKQEYVTNLMNGTNFNWENDKVQAGIAVIDNNTGAIVAIGAGRNRKGLKAYNYATMINNQIGSTAKPLYDYAPLIEYNDASTYRLYYDEPYTYSGGTPIRNWDNGYNGLITMREALRVSRNIPALKAFQENQNENVKNFVKNIGLSPEADLHEAHAIGAYNGESPLSVAAAYSTFANGGYYTEPYAFTKIVYRNSDEEYEYKPKTTKVMSEATAYMVADMLVTTSGWATGSSSVNGISYGSKTGTTNYDDKTMALHNLPGDAVNDLWVAGICRDYATAIWYGYDEISNQYYNHGNGNTRLYSQLIKGVFTGTPSFTKPNGVVSVTVEKDSPGNGLLPSANTPNDMKITELFKAGTEPTKVSTRFNSLGNVSNLKASLNGNRIALSWDGIATPDALNGNYLNSLYSSTCKNVGACVNTILGANQRMLGNVQYQIYVKNGDGSLRLLHGVTATSTEENIPSDARGKVTFVVKTAYSNFGPATSNGVEVTVDISSVKIDEEISATIIGNTNVTLTDSGNYKDQYVKVMEGNTDVTSKANIKFSIGGSGKATKTGELSYNLEAGEYTVTYEISYKKYNKTLTRKIIVK